MKKETKEKEVEKEEIIPETPEVKEDPIVEVEEASVEDNLFDMDVPRLSREELFNAIEEERQTFLKASKKSNLINRIIFGVVLVLILGSIIVAMVIMSQGIVEGNWPTYLALGVGGGCLLGVLLYTFLAKKAINRKQVDYINSILTNYGNYLYRGQNYGGYAFNAHDRFTLETFSESLIYKDVKKITSRAIYSVKYHDTLIKIAELMAEVSSTEQKRKTIAIFIGRYFVAKNNLNLKRPIYIYIKGRPDIVSYPTEVDHMKLIKQTERFDILGVPGDEKILSTKLLDEIRKIKVDEVLLDCTIAFHPGRTYISVNYSNEAVDFPYQKEFDDSYLEHYNNDNLIIREIIDIANKQEIK